MSAYLCDKPGCQSPAAWWWAGQDRLCVGHAIEHDKRMRRAHRKAYRLKRRIRRVVSALLEG